jgi:hypothetical protein
MPTVSPVALPGHYIEVDIIIHSVAEWITSKKREDQAEGGGARNIFRGVAERLAG